MISAYGEAPLQSPQLPVSIYDDVIAFIEAPGREQFESLALRVFRHQFDTVASYRDYCLQLGAAPDNVDSLAQVPMVSTIAFKYARLWRDGAEKSAAARLFLTSGTTVGSDRRGRHLVPRPEVYRLSAMRHIARMLFPEERRMAALAIHPTAELMGESSLAQMISWCLDEFATDQRLCVADRVGVDLARACEFMLSIERKGLPLCILGTTAAFAALFGFLRDHSISIRLAPGSRAMDTGGAKGQAVPLAAEEAARWAFELLGIEPSNVVNEYGMTEMCSQLYDATALNCGAGFDGWPRMKLAPPWLRPVALDPVTLDPAGDGEVGMLGFFDLANVGSVSALVTEDLGLVGRDGLVHVLGRASSAETRGCALAIEEFRQVSRKWSYGEGLSGAG